MSSDQEPGPTHTPYGQSDPYGQPPQGQPYGQAPYGQAPYGQPVYGQVTGERRPGTVTAAAWTTIVSSVLVAIVFCFVGLALFVARDDVITEMEAVPEFQDANIDADAVVGVLAAVVIALVVWSLIAVVLAVFVLRRSNTARILLVISASVVAVLSLLGISGGAPVVTLIAAVATIVLLFTGGAGDWFKRAGGYPSGYPADPYGTSPYPSNPYGEQHGQPGGTPAGTSTDNPYGAPPGQENPYGRQPTEGEDQPPKDHPGR
jgi:hypothetical protein